MGGEDAGVFVGVNLTQDCEELVLEFEINCLLFLYGEHQRRPYAFPILKPLPRLQNPKPIWLKNEIPSVAAWSGSGDYLDKFTSQYDSFQRIRRHQTIVIKWCSIVVKTDVEPVAAFDFRFMRRQMLAVPFLRRHLGFVFAVHGG